MSAPNSFARLGVRILAFLVRDFFIATSYRLSFLLQLSGVFFAVTSFYFLSRLFGQSPELLAEYGGDYLSFAVVGLALMSYFHTSFQSFATSIRNEQVQGTLEAVLLTPTGVATFAVASSAWDFLWSTWTAAVYIGFGWLLFGVEIRGSLALGLGLLLLTILVFSSLGVLSASFVMVFKRGDPMAFVLGGLSAMLGGVFYPVRVLPEWLQSLAALLPITHALDGLRRVLLTGATASDPMVQRDIMVLLLFGAVATPASLLAFRAAVKLARREGTLVQY